MNKKLTTKKVGAVKGKNDAQYTRTASNKRKRYEKELAKNPQNTLVKKALEKL